MNENENIIRENIHSVLSSREVKIKTDEISGSWKLNENEIEYIHPMPSHIEFAIVLVNGGACLRVSAKINRNTSRLSNIVVNEV